MANLRVERLEAPALGQDSDSAPEVAPKGKAPILQNFLPGYPGLIRMRGPLTTSASTLGANPADKIAGLWHHGDTVIVGVRAGHATQTHEHHTTWYRRATAATLARGTTTMYSMNLLDGTGASVAVTRATTPGPKYTRQRRYLYGPAYDTATDAGTDIHAADGAGATWIIRRVSLLRFDTQGALAAPVSYGDNAPRGAQDAKMHYNRLFLAGGPSGFSTNPTSCVTGAFATDIEPNALWYSQDFGQATPDASVNANGDLKAEVCRWAHPLTFAKNMIVVDSADPGDFIVGLAKIGRNLAIFKRHSIHVLYGYGPSTFSVRQFAHGIGCLDPRSIVEVDEGCFFMAHDGFYYFDGSQLINVSDNAVDAVFHESALNMVGDAGVDGGMVSAAKLSNEYIGVAISHASFTLSGGVRVPSVPQAAMLLYVPQRAWTTFSSDVLITTSQPTWFKDTDTRSFCTDDTTAWEMSNAVSPLTADEDRRGIDGDIGAGFIIDNTTTFSGAGNTLQTGALQAWTSGTGVMPIVAIWNSRLLRLGTPLMRAQLHRIGIDYRFIPDGEASPGAEEGWYVTVYDGDNNVLVPTYRLTVQADPPTEYSRRRHRKDVFAEATDVHVKIEWLGPEQAIAFADILDVFLEYQTTREFH